MPRSYHHMMVAIVIVTLCTRCHRCFNIKKTYNIANEHENHNAQKEHKRHNAIKPVDKINREINERWANIQMSILLSIVAFSFSLI